MEEWGGVSEGGKSEGEGQLYKDVPDPKRNI